MEPETKPVALNRSLFHEWFLLARRSCREVYGRSEGAAMIVLKIHANSGQRCCRAVIVGTNMIKKPC